MPHIPDDLTSVLNKQGASPVNNNKRKKCVRVWGGGGVRLVLLEFRNRKIQRK